MQYLLTEKEYQELSSRPTQSDHNNLAKSLRRIAMKAAGIKELPCGIDYCDDCIFSGNYAPREEGSYTYRNICPNKEKRNFSK